MFGILIFGDSITFGKGESPRIGWVGRLKKDIEPQGFNHAIFNLGIPGNSSTDLLKRIEAEIKSRIDYKYPRDKFLIIIAIGTNDLRGIGSVGNVQTNPKNFKKNFERIISLAKKYTKSVVVIGLTPVDESITNPFEDTYFINENVVKYNEILKDVSSDERVLFIDLFSKINKLDYRKLLSDGIHPNKKGYEEMYKIISNTLIKNKLI
jgi:acyl-CoA thioesterase I